MLFQSSQAADMDEGLTVQRYILLWLQMVTTFNLYFSNFPVFLTLSV